MESPITKVVMHFYHTDSKIQIQGGYLPSSGTSSASWVVKNLIEPLALAHIDTNRDSISVINEAILEGSSSFSCVCKLSVNPSAKSAKDRSISCQMCRRNFPQKVHRQKRTTWIKLAETPMVLQFLYSCFSKLSTSVITRHTTTSKHNPCKSYGFSPPTSTE